MYFSTEKACSGLNHFANAHVASITLALNAVELLDDELGAIKKRHYFGITHSSK